MCTQTILGCSAAVLFCCSASVSASDPCDGTPTAQPECFHFDTVNSVLGDVSFEEAFSETPNAMTNETLRLQTHLAHVESLLRSRDTSSLTPELQEARAMNLDLLHEYREAGVFPQNLDYPGERRPCFIDREDRICAVGYLIEMTAGRELAEQVNERYQYDLVFDMDMPELGDWVAHSGLSLVECGMIQPAYGFPVPCAADFNEDWFVDFHDLLEVLAAWGPCDPKIPVQQDLNHDDVVDFTDLLDLIGRAIARRVIYDHDSHVGV